MNNNESKFPKIQKSITDFIKDEDGNITRNKLLSIGTMVVVLSAILSIDVYAKHGSHSSHSSTSYVRGHSNSHSSHSNFHSSHASHTSHSNTVAHSNSNYSAGGDYTVPTAPTASAITNEAIKVPVQNNFEIPIPDHNITIPSVQALPDSPSIFPKKDV